MPVGVPVVLAQPSLLGRSFENVGELVAVAVVVTVMVAALALALALELVLALALELAWG